MMTSVLVSPDGNFEYEAAHGTVVDHYHKWREGKPVSTNPLATIAGWAGALHKRGELDGNEDLMHFADCLSKAGVDVFEDGYLSEDLARLCDPAELREMPENGGCASDSRAAGNTLICITPKADSFSELPACFLRQKNLKNSKARANC